MKGEIEEITLRPEIWWHDAVYHQLAHCMKWTHLVNIHIFWSRPAEGALVLWTSCYFSMFLLSTLWWPNIWPKTSFLGLFEKHIFNLFHPWHVTLWDECLEPYSCSRSCRQFWPSGGHIFAWKGVSKIFLPRGPPVGNTMPDCLEGWVVPQWLQYMDLCWIFLDKMASNQSRGAFSPCMGRAHAVVLILTQGLWQFRSIEIECSHYHFGMVTREIN